VSGSSEEEPKSKGDPDQFPLIMEVHEFNPERRFVIVPKYEDADSDDESPNGSPRVPKITTSGDYKANTGRKYEPNPMYEMDTAAAAGGLAGGLAAQRGSAERRKSMSRSDLPRIETRVDDYPPRYRTKSATGVNQPQTDDYFSPQYAKRQSEALLTPEVIKHSTSRREREEKYYDYSRSPNGNTAPPMQRSRSGATDGYDEKYDRQNATTAPNLKRAISNADQTKQSRRVSGDRHDQSRYRDDREYAPSRSERKPGSPPITRRETEREGLSRRSSTYKKKDSPPRRGDSYSGDEKDKLSRVPSYRRRKSIVTQETLPVPGPDRSSVSGRSRSKAPSSPIPSPRVSASQFPDEVPSSPRSSFTFPRDMRRPDERFQRSYPDGDSPPRSSRLTVQGGNERGAARSRSRAASLKDPSLAMPIAIPLGQSSPTERKRSPMPSPPETRSSLSQSSPRQEHFWQPPHFSPPQNGPRFGSVGSYRRYSEDANRGELPECQRKTPASGYTDWLTLPRSDNFNICPSCYTGVFLNSPFRNQFVPMPFRPSDKEIACDFGSSPWYRIAWLLTMKNRKSDLRLFHQISQVAGNASSKSQPCPGARKTTRLWYSIRDPYTQKIIPDFNVCFCCAKMVEVLLPNLTGVFVPLDSPATPTRGVCAMHFSGSERKRFVLYFDAMETTSDKALSAGAPPDIQSLAEEIGRLSIYTECREDQVVKNGNWHSMRFLPDLTVCGECFDEVVRPKVEDGNTIARNFYINPQRVPVATCQLYSARMREVFRNACRTNNPKFLEEKVLERRKIEEDIHAKITKLDERGEDDMETQEEVEKLIREWKRWE
jgi:hypothetical protein